MGRPEDVDQGQSQPRREFERRLPRRPSERRQEPSRSRPQRDDEERRSMGRCRADVDTRRRLAKVHRYDRPCRPERLRLLGRFGSLERVGHYGLRAALPRKRPFPIAAALLDSRREDAGKDPQGEYQLRQVGGRGLCNRYAGQCHRLRLRQGGYPAYRGRLRPADIGLRPLELFADDHRLAERGDGVQPLRAGLRLDVGTDQGVRETGADREDRTLRQSGLAMDARIDARQDRSCGQHQTRQGEIDAEDRRHCSLDHGTRGVDDGTDR